MKFRKSSLRSVHTSSQKDFKNIQLNEDDIRLINGEDLSHKTNNQTIGEEKQNSILNKLLLLQPIQKNVLTDGKGNNKMNGNKKLSLNYGNSSASSQKFNQKFQKPDVETLIQENIQLKTLIQSNNQTINSLRVKNKQFQKKCAFLQKGMQKYEKLIISQQNNKNKKSYEQENQKQNQSESDVQNVSNKIFSKSTANCNNMTGIVHTQILKKKITDLTNMYIKAENELKALRRLPNATIYEQNDIEKQHLIAETVRLKAIVASLSSELNKQQYESEMVNNQMINFGNNMQMSSEEKFQSHFMRLMKEENEKLKSTIRLLQNDKILLKSRQTIMNKYNNDLKKQLQGLKQKLLYKQAEVEKLNNENKNLLFKKTTQYKQQEEKKQNQVISELRNKLISVEGEYKKMQELNDFYSEQNVNLKQKQKNLLSQLSEIQAKYQKNIKLLNEQIEQQQFQLNNVKMDYYNLLRQGTNRKKKSVVNQNILNGIGNLALGANNINNQPTQNQADNQGGKQNFTRKGSIFKVANHQGHMNKLTNPGSNENMMTGSNAFNLMLNINGHTKKSQNKNCQSSSPHQREVYNKKVRFQDIYLGLLHLYHISLLFESSEPSFKEEKDNYLLVIDKILIRLIEDDSDVQNKMEYVRNLSYANQSEESKKKKKCYELINVFCEEPYYLERKQAVKLARYIVEDDTKIVQVSNKANISQSHQKVSNNNPSINQASSSKRNQKILFNQMSQVQLILVKNILKSSLQKIKQKDNKQKYEQKWLQILNRNNSRKILEALYQQENGPNSDNNYEQNHTQRSKYSNGNELVRLEQLIEVLNSRVSRKKIQPEDYEYLTIRCFDKVHSEYEIFVNLRKVIKFFEDLIYTENHNNKNVQDKNQMQ